MLGGVDASMLPSTLDALIESMENGRGLQSVTESGRTSSSSSCAGALSLCSMIKSSSSSSLQDWLSPFTLGSVVDSSFIGTMVAERSFTMGGGGT